MYRYNNLDISRFEKYKFALSRGWNYYHQRNIFIGVPFEPDVTYFYFRDIILSDPNNKRVVRNYNYGKVYGDADV